MSSEALEAKRLRENATRRNMMGLLMTCEPADVLALLAEVARLEQEADFHAHSYDEWRERAKTAVAALAVAREREQPMREALEQVAAVQPEMLETLRRHKVVFDGPLGNDPKNWQHVAFSIYTRLCEVDSIARAALVDEPAAAAGEPTWDGDGFEQPPAAATLAEPGEGGVEGDVPQDRGSGAAVQTSAENGATGQEVGLAAPGSASAAADEPTRSCAKPTRGIYGVRSRCARPLGHYGDCDSIWNHRDWTVVAADEPGERALSEPGGNVTPQATDAASATRPLSARLTEGTAADEPGETPA